MEGAFFDPIGQAGTAYLGVYSAKPGIDSLTGGVSFVFDPDSIVATVTWDIEFSSLDGGVRMNGSLTDVGGMLTALDAFGQSVTLGEGALLANGRYIFNYSISLPAFKGDGFSGAGADLYFESAAIPAPGAVALLGLAGLAGRRRR
jgi:MYXO-CTERM domain-containing protein